MMERVSIFVLATTMTLCIVFVTIFVPRNTYAVPSSPIYGVTIPAGYRQWEVVAPAEEAHLNELRVVVGNEIAIKAYRNGALPFPNGSILVKMAWKRVPSTEISGAFVPGAPTTVQIMVKDTQRYASTDGWGFGRFINGEPADAAQQETCYACHAGHVKGHDLVFTRWAP